MSYLKPTSLTRILTHQTDLVFPENALNTHDLAIPLPRQNNPNDSPRTLRTLLLSPTSTTPTTLPTTLTRIHHFAALNASIDSIIIFLLATPDDANANTNATTPLHAYTHLTTTLLATPALAALPILPLATLPALSSLLKTYITTHSAARAAQAVHARRGAGAFNAAYDLLPWCTAETPLGVDEVHAVTDWFGSVGDVAGAGREGDGRVEGLVGVLGRERVGEVLDFWVEEWVAL